jgi:hypothetical protein
VGALLVRRSALAKLKRPWFAGGTIGEVTFDILSCRIIRDGS